MLTQYFQPEPNFKGLPLAKALRDRGHQVQVLTGFPNYPGGKLYAGYKLRLWLREEMDGIEIVRVPLIPSHNRNGIHRILNYLSFGLAACMLGPCLIKKPDIVFVYNLITLGPAFRAIRMFTGARVVIDVLDLWPESVNESGMLRSTFASRILAWWCKHEYQAADKLIACTPGFKQNLANRGIDQSKLEMIYNWCDESSINVPVPDPTVSEELGFSNHFNIVFAGTMGVMQALDTVIEAARFIQVECPDVRFTFVGGGIEVDRLKTAASSLPNVVFLPQMPPSEIGKVLANADVLLVHLKNVPIFEITIPSKVQAYMYAGKPILCGVRGDAATLVHLAGAGVVFEPENARSLVDAIRKLKSMMPSELRDMGLSGKRFYDDKLSFVKGVSQLESVFHDTVPAK